MYTYLTAHPNTPELLSTSPDCVPGHRHTGNTAKAVFVGDRSPTEFTFTRLLCLNVAAVLGHHWGLLLVNFHRICSGSGSSKQVLEKGHCVMPYYYICVW